MSSEEIRDAERWPSQPAEHSPARPRNSNPDLDSVLGDTEPVNSTRLPDEPPAFAPSGYGLCTSVEVVIHERTESHQVKSRGGTYRCPHLHEGLVPITR